MEFRGEGLSWSARRRRFSAGSAGFGLALGMAIGALLLAERDTVALFGGSLAVNRLPESLGNVLFLLSVLLGMVVVGLGYRRLYPYDPALSEAEQLAAHRGMLFGQLGVMVGVTGGLVIALIVALAVISALNAQIVMSFAAAWLIGGIYGGLLAGGLAYWVVTLKRREVFRLALIVLVSGILIAITAAANGEWWRNSLSAIGYDASSGFLFNLALIVGGLVVLSVALDLLAALRVLRENNLLSLRDYSLMHYGLIAISLMLTAIGLFPTTITYLSNALHVFAASGMVLTIMVLMFVVTFVISIYGAAFRFFSSGCAAACIGLGISHFALRQMIFTVFEVLLLLILGAWMFVLHHQTEQFIRRQDIPNYP